MKNDKICGTMSAEAIVGVNAGYGHNNEAGIDFDAIAEILKGILSEVESETGIYVSGSISEARTVYKTEWGCPNGGEKTFRFTADCNPTYSSLSQEEYRVEWSKAYLLVIERLMGVFEQTTVTARVGSEVFYLHNN